MAITGIAFVMYPVTDMQAARTFYEHVVGLTQSGLASSFWVEFEIAGTTFGIGNFEQVGVPGTAGSLSFEVSDIQAYRERLRAHGVESAEPHVFPSCVISSFKDPDGNDIFIHQALPQAVAEAAA